jgi:putative ABC transport system ATP-binding protein
LLQLDDVHCRRGTGEQRFTVSISRFSLKRGETVAITGRSGCGKSTVLEVLGLVLRPDQLGCFGWTDQQGAELDVAALWSGRDDTGLARLRASRIGFVLQTGGLLPYLTVRRNIGLTRRLLGLQPDSERVEELVATLGIGHLLNRKPHQLSIGERQRVSIARALAHDPQLFLADEPTSALDPHLADEVFDLMVDAVQRSGSAAVIVTHDQDRVRELGLREVRARLVQDAGRDGSVFEG